MSDNNDTRVFTGKCVSMSNLTDIVNDYSKNGGTKCPFCKSDQLLFEQGQKPQSIDRLTSLIKVTCLVCGETWTDEYSLTAVYFQISGDTYVKVDETANELGIKNSEQPT